MRCQLRVAVTRGHGVLCVGTLVYAGGVPQDTKVSWVSLIMPARQQQQHTPWHDKQST